MAPSSVQHAPGRARTKHLHPLTYAELGSRFDLSLAIERGTLPSICFSYDPVSDLRAYAGTYLQQEIVAQGVTRNAPAFSRFLRVAALRNAAVVNFTNGSNDAQVARTTVYEYFETLKDTLVLFEPPVWRAGARARGASPSSRRGITTLTLASPRFSRVARCARARRSSDRRLRNT